MSHCPFRNHAGPLLIEDFEGIADDFLRFSLVVLPESRRKEINTIMQGSVIANNFVLPNSLGHKLQESWKVQRPFSISIHLPLPRNQNIKLCFLSYTHMLSLQHLCTCLIISATSASDGIFPKERISLPSSEVETAPSASLFNELIYIKVICITKKSSSRSHSLKRSAM